METKFWYKNFILSICLRYSIALNQTEVSEYAVITIDDNTRIITTETPALATTKQSDRQSKWHQHELKGCTTKDIRITYKGDLKNNITINHFDDTSNMKAMSQDKNDYWSGYYDFLVNEGSYKFWAVFQLATAALLIYSGFAALYYAKVYPQMTEDYDDFLLRGRRRFVNRGGQPHERPFFGLEPQSFQRIVDAVGWQMR